MELSPEHQAIVISANEDYLILRDAALELLAVAERERAQAQAVQSARELTENGYTYRVCTEHICL